MAQNRFIQNLWLGGAAIVALLVAIFLVLEPATSSRTAQKVCIPLYAADILCFGKSEQLSPDKPTALAISSSGTLLAAGQENGIALWDLKTRRLLTTLRDHTQLITAIAISADEKILASSSLDGTIKLWDLPNRRLVSTLRAGRASNLAFSPDSRILASSSRARRWADGEFSPVGVQIWDIATRRRIYSLGEQPIRAIGFSPDGTLLATGDGTKTEIWKVQDGDRLRTLDSGEVTGLLFCQDGQTLITGSSRIKSWDLRNGALLKTFSAGASDLALSPDGQTLATAAGGAVHLWHLLHEQSLGSLPATPFSNLSVKFALQGQAIIAGGSDGIHIWSDPNPTLQSFSSPAS
ncbi:WD40 repeat domain-containing protein [Leptolyngbya sp. DQ-M1]|uniref:WD40 repeat domain-containing protein n=1 Tax=Leptolyngbya sp. DQ-M1 TaxID=2933920 RepID=UPI00329848FA